MTNQHVDERQQDDSDLEQRRIVCVDVFQHLDGNPRCHQTQHSEQAAEDEAIALEEESQGYDQRRNATHGQDNSQRGVLQQVGRVVDADNEQQDSPHGTQRIEHDSPEMLLVLSLLIAVHDFLVLAVGLLLGIEEAPVVHLVLVYLTEFQHPFLQSALVAVLLFEGLMGILMVVDRHPLAQGSVSTGREQQRAQGQLVVNATFRQVGTVLQLHAVIQQISRLGPQNATVAISCGAQVVGTQAFAVLLALQVKAGLGFVDLLKPAM